MAFTNSPYEPVSVTVNNQTINEVTETKFLGVILDNKLCWDAHIKHISNKMSKSVSILKMLKYTFPTKALKTIYHSLIYPYFNYCNLIWGSAASSHLNSITLIQKKCIRIISKAGYYDHTEPLFNEHKVLTRPVQKKVVQLMSKLLKSCIRIISKAGYYDHAEPLFNEHNVLTVPKIYNYNCAKFIYQCYNNNTYTNFKNKLLKNSDIHNYNTRSKDILRKPFVRLHKLYGR